MQRPQAAPPSGSHCGLDLNYASHYLAPMEIDIYRALTGLLLLVDVLERPAVLCIDKRLVIT